MRAIALHDVGWTPYEGDVSSPQPAKRARTGVLLSFANAAPELFLRAWTASIQAAQSTGPLGGLLVSAHFARLTHPYLDRARAPPSSAPRSSSSSIARPRGSTACCRRLAFRSRRSRP